MEEFKKYKNSLIAEEYGVKELNDDDDNLDPYSDSEINNKSMPINKPIMPKTLQSDVEKMLNERLGDEYTAYYFYRNAANWCKNVNYKKATTFFNSEAEGELGHAQGIQDYLIQWNLTPQIPQVETSYNFTSLIDVINKAYEIEYNLLQKYSSNQKELDAKDPATFNFIQKYVDIQNGEVEEYSDLLNALQLIDVNNKFEILYFENTYF